MPITEPTVSELKASIKNIIRRGAKEEYLLVIEAGLNNSEIKDKDWIELFESQGASEAIKQKFYSPDMIRLLTLQAMIFPPMLLQLLDWLKPKQLSDNSYQVCHKFQSEIRDTLKVLPTIEKNILVGVKISISELIYHQERLAITGWLLRDSKGCWGELYRRVVRQKLDYVLNNYNATEIDFEQDKWGTIVKVLTLALQSEQSKIFKDYCVLGDLFYLTHDYEIAAIFYHVSLGGIPKKVFNNLVADDLQIKAPKVYGITIKSQRNLFDVIGNIFSLIISLIFGIIAFFFGAIKFLFLFFTISGSFAFEFFIFVSLIDEMRYMTADEFTSIVIGLMFFSF